MAEAHATHDDHAPKHDYYLVDPSPWPFVGAVAAFFLTIGAAMWMHGVKPGGIIMTAGFLGVLYTMFVWWRDVLKEAIRGDYSEPVAGMLRVGMVLFITSEVLFFVAWFWAFFWGALLPPDTMAASWPPEGIEPIPAFGIPFLNTLILLLSGTTVTWAHHALREGDQQTCFKALVLTCLLGAIFTGFQVYEYVHLAHLGLTMSSGVFGSAFYMATGFHGFHVLVGTLFLLVCTKRAYDMTFKAERHVGFEAAAWYWHFVDVVWLFLFVCVYIWGGSLEWSTTGLG